jgi:ferredoxin
MTETRVLYFTGTGGSLRIARIIAETLGTTPQDILRVDPASLNPQPLVLVFPIYGFAPPGIVLRFISSMADGKGNPARVVAVPAGMALKAGYMALKALKKRGYHSAGSWTVVAPCNINLWPLYTPNKEQVKQFWEKREPAAKKAAAEIASGKEKGTWWGPSVWLGKACVWSFRLPLIGSVAFARRFSANDKCIKCRSCERLCPRANIKVGEKGPVWGNACEVCLRCYHYCPKEAIENKFLNNKSPRYHDPTVPASDLILR